MAICSGCLEFQIDITIDALHVIISFKKVRNSELMSLFYCVNFHTGILSEVRGDTFFR